MKKIAIRNEILNDKGQMMLKHFRLILKNACEILFKKICVQGEV